MSQMRALPQKQAPADADTINHKLLVQAGFVRQLMAGVYSYLPLGLRVLNKIDDVVREEMDKIGGQELLMPILHPARIWKQTGGWDSIDVLFKVKSRTDKEYALGQSQEEVVTPLLGEFIQSYRDLPVAVYHIQWKFRDELRAKSGILRGREFEMKDMYSFHETQEDFEKFYEIVKQAYLKIFKKFGLVAKATEAAGGNFTDKISYEFMVLTDAGEDDILYCPVCEFCVNEEIAEVNEGAACPNCDEGYLDQAVASEVGNVFDIGSKYSKDFDITFTDKNGEKKHPVMGCYGIGTSRTMGVVVEKFNDEKGIVWPELIAPFKVHLIDIDQKDEAEDLYDLLIEEGVEVLWDDRDESVGAKFADAELIGNPWRVVISEKSLKQGGVELKRRGEEEVEIISEGELLDKMHD